MSNFCINCGIDNPDSARYCSLCGTPLDFVEKMIVNEIQPKLDAELAEEEEVLGPEEDTEAIADGTEEIAAEEAAELPEDVQAEVSADAPADVQAEVSADAPVDAPADTPVDASADASRGAFV